MEIWLDHREMELKRTMVDSFILAKQLERRSAQRGRISPESDPGPRSHESEPPHRVLSIALSSCVGIDEGQVISIHTIFGPLPN